MNFNFLEIEEGGFFCYNELGNLPDDIYSKKGDNMDDFKLGSAHDGWEMIIGESKPVKLLESVIDDGVPENLVGMVAEVYKRRAVVLYDECVVQYGIEIGEDHWVINEDSVEEL